MPGKGAFRRCVEKVGASGRVRSPGGVCAAAGRKKYGAKRFQAMAAAGRRKKNSAESDLSAGLNSLLSMSPTGSALKAIEAQREKLQRKMTRENKRKKNPSWRKTVKRTKKSLKRLGVSDWDAPIAQKRKFKAARKNWGKKKVTYHAVRTKKTGTRDSHGYMYGFKVKNPRNPVATAREAYEAFHGRPSSELIDIVTPMHEHTVTAGIGDLKKLVVKSIDGRTVTIKNFGVNQQGIGALLTMNEARTQLFIDGGDQSVDLEAFGVLEPFREWETLGQVKKVFYFTRKDHLGRDGGTATYHHTFGGMVEVRLPSGKIVRRRARLPDLIYDTRNKLLYFSGGGYTLPDEGIEN